MSERLTDEQIAELEHALRDATPGPWNWGREGRYMTVRARRMVIATVYGSDGDADALDPLPDLAHAALLAYARNFLPSLLAEVRASRSSPPDGFRRGVEAAAREVESGNVRLTVRPSEIARIAARVRSLSASPSLAPDPRDAAIRTLEGALRQIMLRTSGPSYPVYATSTMAWVHKFASACLAAEVPPEPVCPEVASRGTHWPLEPGDACQGCGGIAPGSLAALDAAPSSSPDPDPAP